MLQVSPSRARRPKRALATAAAVAVAAESEKNLRANKGAQLARILFLEVADSGGAGAGECICPSGCRDRGPRVHPGRGAGTAAATPAAPEHAGACARCSPAPPTPVCITHDAELTIDVRCSPVPPIGNRVMHDAEMTNVDTYACCSPIVTVGNCTMHGSKLVSETRGARRRTGTSTGLARHRNAPRSRPMLPRAR